MSHSDRREVFHLVINDGEYRSTIIGTYRSHENAGESLISLQRINPKVAGNAYIVQSLMPPTFICDDDIDEDEDIYEDEDNN